MNIKEYGPQGALDHGLYGPQQGPWAHILFNIFCYLFDYLFFNLFNIFLIVLPIVLPIELPIVLPCYSLVELLGPITPLWGHLGLMSSSTETDKRISHMS